MSNDTRSYGQHYRADGSFAVMGTPKRAVMTITNDGEDSLVIMDRDAVVTGTRDTGYHVTAPWMGVDAKTEKPRTWVSFPTGQMILGDRGLHVSTQDMIEACMAAPDRTVRVADLPQLTRP